MQQFLQPPLQMLSTKYQRYFKRDPKTSFIRSHFNISKIKTSPKNTEMPEDNNPHIVPLSFNSIHPVYPVKINKSLPSINKKKQDCLEIFHTNEQKFYNSFYIHRSPTNHQTTSSRSPNQSLLKNSKKVNCYLTFRTQKQGQRVNLENEHQNKYVSVQNQVIIKCQDLERDERKNQNGDIQMMGITFRKSKQVPKSFSLRAKENSQKSWGEKKPTESERRKFFDTFLRQRLPYNREVSKHLIRPQKPKISKQIKNQSKKVVKQMQEQKIQPWDNQPKYSNHQD